MSSLVETRLLGGMNSVEHVANSVVSLASEDAGWVTSINISVGSSLKSCDVSDVDWRSKGCWST